MIGISAIRNRQNINFLHEFKDSYQIALCKTMDCATEGDTKYSNNYKMCANVVLIRIGWIVLRCAKYPDLQFSQNALQKFLDSQKRVTKEVEEMRL
ncbi:hypothetical protein MTR_3g027380 [Medicago truncatula]|uniref:Uncharacterized protein n=1 Tax=Medicago truncatula TaxID=3880 RepID=G7J1U9_MEDTR|nr:hypothetical protein MTR_3g027380 [Medicago truncatula]